MKKSKLERLFHSFRLNVVDFYSETMTCSVILLNDLHYYGNKLLGRPQHHQ